MFVNKEGLPITVYAPLCDGRCDFEGPISLKDNGMLFGADGSVRHHMECIVPHKASPSERIGGLRGPFRVVKVTEDDIAYGDVFDDVEALQGAIKAALEARAAEKTG
jgi:hypothetical protein